MATQASAAEFTQARIRINREGALLLEQVLIREEEELMKERERGDAAVRVEVQRELRVVQRILEEVYRAMDDRSWR